MLIDIPCKIGDIVYVLRKFNGVMAIRKGRVTHMYFIDEQMRLSITANKIGRGQWGVKVFPTYEAAYKKLQKMIEMEG